MMYIILGYLSGSVLFARVFARLFGKENILESSRDGNPGTANAFVYGGFWCGLLTLAGDLLKGFVPVFLYINRSPDLSALPLVLAAPVIGHAFPLFFGFRGGKAIAVSFGCLLGLLPMWQPVAVLAFFFIFYSLVLRITPHYHRTLVTYASTLLCLGCMDGPRNVWFGFFLITMTVAFRMLRSKEEKDAMKVRLLWMR